MKTTHITDLLDGKAFTELSSEDLAAFDAHINVCLKCRHAFQASQISSVLLRANADTIAPTPSPFFQAKVMNAWREKQSLQKPIEAFRRWWQASAAPIFAMLMIVVGLIAISALTPVSDTNQAQAGISDFNLYSADMVILDQKPPRDLTTEQVFEVLYNTKSDFGKQR